MHRYTATPFSFVNFLADLLEGLLALRFILVFLGANSAQPLVRAFYGFSEPFVAPFRGIFGDAVISGYTIEWSTIIAMVVYALLATLLMRFIVLLATAAENEHESHHHLHHRV